jgi:hypothetical protein
LPEEKKQPKENVSTDEDTTIPESEIPTGEVEEVLRREFPDITNTQLKHDDKKRPRKKRPRKFDDKEI